MKSAFISGFFFELFFVKGLILNLHFPKQITNMKPGLLLLLALCLLTSCAERYYSAGPGHIPALTKARQANVGAGFHFTEKAVGLQLQSSLAVSNRVGLMLNAHSNSAEVTIESNGVTTSDKSNATYAEAGIGLFFPVHTDITFETYVGYGTGGIRNRNVESENRVGTHRIFLQPAFSAFNKNHTVSFSFATRFSFVNTRIKSLYEAPNGPIFSDVKAVNVQPNSLFFEPSIQLRAGKINQFSLQLSSIRSFSAIDYTIDRWNMSFGYNLRLNY